MSGCPSTSLEVKTSSEGLKCAQPEVYHCLRNQVGEKTEKCIKPSWIQRGLCAEYNTIAERLDAKGCQLSRGLCPDKAYLSNDVISFSGCAPNEVVVTTINTTSSNNIRFESHGEGISMVIIIPILCIAVIGIALGVTLLFHYRRKSCGHTNGDEENTVPLMNKEGNSGNDDEEKKKNHLKKEEERLKYFVSKGEPGKYLLDSIKDFLVKDSNAVIVGKPGSGKTTLAWTLCKQMHDEIYEGKKWHVKTSTTTDDLPDEDTFVLLLLDGPFESGWTTKETVKIIFDGVEELRNQLPRKQLRIISTISNEAFQRISKYDSMKSLNPFGKIDLDNKKYSLTHFDMGEVYKTHSISIRNVADETTSKILSQRQMQRIHSCFNPVFKFNIPKLGFPLIASLMALHAPFLADSKFVENPVENVLNSIRQLKESEKDEDHNKYCTVVYASLNGGYVDVEKINETLMKEIGDHHNFKDPAPDPEFYMLRKTKVWGHEFIHESILRVFLAEYGKQNLKFVIKHCNLCTLLEYSVSNREKLSDSQKMFHLVIGGSAYEKELTNRITSENIDIERHRIWEQKGFQDMFKGVYTMQTIEGKN